MLSRFVTEAHLVQGIWQVVSRGSFIVFIRYDRVRLDVSHAFLINPTKSHHGFRVAKVSALNIEVYSLLHAL